MSTVLPLQTLVAIVLATAVLVASARVLLATRAGRLGGARCTGMLVLQAVAMVLLYLVMFPPAGTREAGVLTVLAGGAGSTGRDGTVVALPEYAGSGPERVPDLATALRRHPDTRRIHVHGLGLPWRDHDAARSVDVAFESGPEPVGLIDWQLPRNPVAGQRVQLRGRVAGIDAPSVELLDPAGRRLARATPAADGRFMLPLTLHAAGAVDFVLRVLDDDAIVDETTVAVPVGHGQPVQALLLAGAPSPELRALRRWAVDAGVALESRIQLSRDASLGERPDVEAAELEGLDLLMLELRTWRTFEPARREALREAVDGGLGLLLRLDDAPDEDDRTSLRMLGFEVTPIDAEGGVVRLHPSHLGQDPGHSADASERGAREATRLAQRPVHVEADDAAVLLRSDSDAPLALWRSQGQGRAALWWLDDTFPLAVQDDPVVHANLWSSVVSTLARARTLADVDPGVDAGIHARRTLCGIDGDAHVITPGAGTIALVADARGCAGFWPQAPGWHALHASGQRIPFHVSVSPVRHAEAMREATQRLATRPWQTPSGGHAATPGSPWPWFAGFLAAIAALWWLERRRPPTSTPSRTGRPE